MTGGARVRICQLGVESVVWCDECTEYESVEHLERRARVAVLARWEAEHVCPDVRARELRP